MFEKTEYRCVLLLSPGSGPNLCREALAAGGLQRHKGRLQQRQGFIWRGRRRQAALQANQQRPQQLALRAIQQRSTGNVARADSSVMTCLTIRHTVLVILFCDVKLCCVAHKSAVLHVHIAASAQPPCGQL